MLPIVTPDEMRGIDARADEPLDVLVHRAGAAVARHAVRMMGGTYGRVVNVVAGKGNNGADGRVAAALLRARGVQVREFDAANCPGTLPPSHLLIDAAYGTGFRGEWRPPLVADVPVLAVDIPSGVDGLTGAAEPHVFTAARTVTFQAFKPGLLLQPGAVHCGAVDIADVGLGAAVAATARAHVVEAGDVAEWVPARAVNAHKWQAAVRLVAGSPGMTGAATLAAGAAMRAGAGMVHLSAVGCTVRDAPVEVVQQPLSTFMWASEVVGSLDRFHALVVGPGVGRDDATAAEMRSVVLAAPVPVVVDGDALFAMAWNSEGAAALLRRRTMPTVLTPHDGEYQLLTGERPGTDRLQAARALAQHTGCVVLLKGSATVVADPTGEVLVSTTGDQRLATAGSGDVLSGIVGALLAQGVHPFRAAAAGAWLHGAAAGRAPASGMLAGDIAANLPAVLEGLR
ncbi:MAG: hypothetical protein RLZ14_572 [Actinomycetota bacterium]